MQRYALPQKLAAVTKRSEAGDIFDARAQPFRAPRAIEASGSRNHATLIDPRHMACRQKEEVMAKGQMKGNKEAKKPKADKNHSKAAPSAYKLAQGRDGQTISPFTKKS
jgi:hypothetical protein